MMTLKTIGELGHKLKRHLTDPSPCVALRTQHAEPARGRVLLAYILEPFVNPRMAASSTHTHYLESRLIADIYLRRGFDVDVIDYRDHEFIPSGAYDFLISARTNLETFAARLPRNVVTIAHMDTAHYVYNNRAAYDRVLALQQRRGFSSTSIRIVEKNKAIERAAIGTVLGNRTFTVPTYAYAAKPLYPLPVPTAVSLPWIERDYNACRHRFLWMGSAGFVHKGLDLVLEAFAQTPTFELTVCGPLAQDPEFSTQFQRELYRTVNIHPAGWVDVASPEFAALTRRTAAFVYPSCSEGQAGSAVIALHAGLIPIVSAQTGIDVEDFGVIMPDSSVAAVAAAVEHLANLPADELRRRSRAAWEYARARHTPAAYQAAYDSMLSAVLPD